MNHYFLPIIFVFISNILFCDITFNGTSKKPPGEYLPPPGAEVNWPYYDSISTEITNFNGTVLSSEVTSFFRAETGGSWSYNIAQVFSKKDSAFSQVNLSFTGKAIRNYLTLNSIQGLSISGGGYNNTVRITGSYNAVIQGDRLADISGSMEFYSNGTMKVPLSFYSAINDGTAQGSKASYQIMPWKDEDSFTFFVDHFIGYYHVYITSVIPPEIPIPTGSLKSNVSKGRAGSQVTITSTLN